MFTLKKKKTICYSTAVDPRPSEYNVNYFIWSHFFVPAFFIIILLYEDTQITVSINPSAIFLSHGQYYSEKVCNIHTENHFWGMQDGMYTVKNIQHEYASNMYQNVLMLYIQYCTVWIRQNKYLYNMFHSSADYLL